MPSSIEPTEDEHWTQMLEEERAKTAAVKAVDNPSGCCTSGKRVGLVTNQDPDQPYDSSEPHASVSVCANEAHQAKAISKIAGQTNRQAYFFEDAMRRAQKRLVAE